MNSSAKTAALAAPQADWPIWECWLVRRYIGGTVCCARHRDDHQKVINAASPDELAEALEEAASP
jgi:hypothetical protein